MFKRVLLSTAVLTLVLSGCGGGKNDIALLTTTTTPPTNSVLVLQAAGLDVADKELPFDSDQTATLAAATAAFGQPQTSNATCPEGGYEYTEATYRSITLIFSEDMFKGWRSDSEAYDTPEGAHIGSTTEFMLDTYDDFEIDDKSTIDNEWFAGGYQGTLDEDLEEVASLTAGLTCIVR